MTSSRRWSVLTAALLFLLAVNTTAQVTDTAPIKVKAPKPKTEKFECEVLHMTPVAITVRSRDNLNHVRTFTFEGKLAEKMAKRAAENKPYQFGDRITIRYLAGTDRAVKIKGKAGQNRN